MPAKKTTVKKVEKAPEKKPMRKGCGSRCKPKAG